MKIYIDVCGLNRPFDDQSQNRIHLEAESILLILMRCQTKYWKCVSSEIIDFEIEQIPDANRKYQVKILTKIFQEHISIDKNIIERAKELKKIGFEIFDALHISCAEKSVVDIFLTTDDNLLQKYKQNSDKLKIRVENPIIWLMEVEKK